MFTDDRDPIPVSHGAVDMSGEVEELTPIHLVLGSGGARGLAHIGVVRVLRERGYRIESITGCSMGALVGALIVTGHLDAYEEWVCQLTRRDVIRFLDISLLGRSGMVKGDKLMEQLGGWLEGIALEDLPIPLTVVAADIAARKEVWITRGDVLEAVRASIAVPGVFTPLVKHGRVLVDGGILNPLPIPPARIDSSTLTLAVSVSGREVAEPLGPPDTAPSQAPAKPSEDPTPAKDRPAPGSQDAMAELLFAPTGTDPGSVEDGSSEISHQRIEGFLDSLQRFFGRERGSGGAEDAALVARAAKKLEGRERIATRPALTDVMLGMFATMQDIIARHQIAGSPPDVLIDIPRNVCQSHEFYRAREVIDAGAYWARRALDEQRDHDPRSRGGAAARAWKLS
jgi:NTE family protein